MAVKERHGAVGQGMAWRSGRGLVWSGLARHGEAVEAWRGSARPGVVRRSGCGLEWLGLAGRGEADFL